jgi:hypothetical protein
MAERCWQRTRRSIAWGTPFNTRKAWAARELRGASDSHGYGLALREYVGDEAMAPVVDPNRAIRLPKDEQRRKIGGGIVNQPPVHLGDLRRIAGMRVTVAHRHLPDVQLNGRGVRE